MQTAHDANRLRSQRSRGRAGSLADVGKPGAVSASPAAALVSSHPRAAEYGTDAIWITNRFSRITVGMIAFRSIERFTGR